MNTPQRSQLQQDNKETKTFRQGSKIHKARELYLEHKDTHTRKEITIMFMEQLDFSNYTTANTYYQLVKDLDGAKRADTKISKAETIMKEHFGKKSRKEILELFSHILLLTPEVASSYYDRIRKKLI